MSPLTGARRWLLAVGVGAATVALQAPITAYAVGGQVATAQAIPSLLNAHTLTVAGTKGSDGTCTVVPPQLSLSVGQVAMEADETSVDMTNCTAVWQIGVPQKPVTVPTVGSAATSTTGGPTTVARSGEQRL